MELVFFYIVFVVAVAVVASQAKKITGVERSAFGWGALALIVSPLGAGILLAILMAIDYSKSGKFRVADVSSLARSAVSSVAPTSGTLPPVAVLHCEGCGSEGQAGQKFCAKCGGKLFEQKTAGCANCGKDLPDGALFCSGCGTRRADVGDSRQAEPA